ncbi:hypothetical protein C8R43DRAFT_997746 [Mycena crocata]|nr:hypothetical protein C8R43DRAFT_997746 [Mycena crocata]
MASNFANVAKAILQAVTSERSLMAVQKTPSFSFHIQLQLADDHELRHPSLRAHSAFFSPDWKVWFRPQKNLDFAFDCQNWATLGAFREVLDALLGQHMNMTNMNPIPIYNSPRCDALCTPETPLIGDFYIRLTCGDLTNLATEKITVTSTGPSPKTPSSFARNVNARCQGKCVFTNVVVGLEDDIEAAYIIPRPARHIFKKLVQTFLPHTNVSTIDDPCNGIALWVAIHRRWDDAGAMITAQNKLIMCRIKYPLDLLQFRTVSPPSLVPREKEDELRTLLKLRFTHTALIWFCTAEVKKLLAVLGGATPDVSDFLEQLPDDPMSEDDPEEGTEGGPGMEEKEGAGAVGTGGQEGSRSGQESGRSGQAGQMKQKEKPGLTDEETAEVVVQHISPSNSNGSNPSSDGSAIFSVESNSTAPTDHGSTSSPKKTVATAGGDLTEDDEEPEDEEDLEEAEDEEAMETADDGAANGRHWTGCPCDLTLPDAFDAPCVVTLLGMVQLWVSLAR